MIYALGTAMDAAKCSLAVNMDKYVLYSDGRGTLEPRQFPYDIGLVNNDSDVLYKLVAPSELSLMVDSGGYKLQLAKHRTRKWLFSCRGALYSDISVAGPLSLDNKIIFTAIERVSGRNNTFISPKDIILWGIEIA